MSMIQIPANIVLAGICYDINALETIMKGITWLIPMIKQKG